MHPIRRNFQYLLAAIQLGILLLASATARAASITDSKFGFTLDVPDGFVQQASSGDMLYSFATMPDDPTTGTIVSITRMHGTIGREHAEIPAGSLPGHRVYQATWNGFPIDIVAAHQTAFGSEVAVRMVQIPLKYEAVQITIACGVDHEASLDADMSRWVLAINGATNWRTAGEEDYDLGYAAGMGGCFGLVGLLTAAIAFLSLMLLMELLTRLGVTAPMTANVGHRLEMLVTGSAKMSGWIGLIAFGICHGIMRLRRGPAPLKAPESHQFFR